MTRLSGILLPVFSLRRAVDFGLRRAHGAEAGVLAARSACLAGFAATSNVFAARRCGLPK